MDCNSKMIGVVLGAAVIVFAFWQMSYSQWILAIVGALLIIKALMCKNCKTCATPEAPSAPAVKAKPVKK